MRVRGNGRLAFNRPDLIASAARDGVGLAFLLKSQVRGDLEEGRLIPLLEYWCPEISGYHLYYPSRRRHSPAFQLLIDALRHRGAR